MSYSDPWGPKQFDPKDPFLVVKGHDAIPVESQPTMKQANDAVEILNKHEQRNGRPCIYKVVHKDESI